MRTILKFFTQDMAIGDPRNPANDKVTAGYLLSIIGLTNTVSRVFFGYISDKPWVNRLYLYNVALIIAGIGKHVNYRIYMLISTNLVLNGARSRFF